MRRGTAGTQSQALLLSASLASSLAILAALTAIPSSAQAAGDAPVNTAATAPAPKVLRYAIRVAETGFDPVQVTDLYSRNITAAIFDAPLRYSYLGRPYRLEPNITDGMPEVSDDFKRFVFKIKPGIYFNDDPAFKGRKRELVADDLVYTVKRHYDPRNKSGHLYRLEGAKILGLSEVRAEALKNKTPFDYARPVDGVRALDRYTVEIRVANSDPRFLMHFADPMVGLMAREVVEFYGDRIMEHPVGTGAWRLAEWRRSSRMVLEKNPNFRDVRYHEEVGADRPPALVEAVKRLQGRKLPMVDRVEISVIEESQPRWLAFLRKEFDFMDELPEDFAPVAIPQNKLAPNLAKDGMRAVRYERADISASYFNMEDPVVGGYTPEKIALRRAIALGVDVERQVRLPRKGQAIPAQGIISPGVTGYDKSFKTEMSQYDPARAKALLDLYGYVDKDGDGWRDLPDGSPLVLEYATQPDGRNRQLVELWQKDMDALKVRIKFKIAKWPENLKAANAGKLQMWGMGWSADSPDGENFLGLAYGGSKGQSNKARFDLPEFNALFRKQHSMADGPERVAVMQDAQRLLTAYMPYKVEVHRIYTDITQPWVIGYDKNLYQRDFYTFVDIDPDALAKAHAKKH
ncbi:ABC transporter substrate-binding protein [Mitsuaria sp. CC2]|uniref:ABC transporter substrate-binding protein n=1 Tax=Mitsuaria sp. CC2 TaxID=3029186 RepID=UPI003B8D88CF